MILSVLLRLWHLRSNFEGAPRTQEMAAVHASSLIHSTPQYVLYRTDMGDRIRRIKCDETRPACLKCTHTGRKCDGYVNQSGDARAWTQAPYVTTINFQNPFLDFPGTKIEHRFLSFFSYHTAPVISGCFDSDFWNELLPRVSKSEPTIRHAMIAVAAVHARLESMIELIDGIDKQEECRRFELQQYNKAIRLLRIHLSDHGVTLEVTLISCVLLICLEFLRGSIDQAILHLQGGMGILNSYRTNANNSLRISAREERIVRKLNDIFFRLRGQGALCGRLTATINETEFSSGQDLLEKPFSSLDEARSCLDRLLTGAFKFIHLCIRSHHDPSLAMVDGTTVESLTATYLSLSTQLHRWSDNFEAFVAQKGSVADEKFFDGSTMIRMFYIIASVWLSACVSPEESAFDNKHQEFASLLVLASSLSSNSHAETVSPKSPPKPSIKGSPSFTFDMGAIAPLYFVGIACRDRKIRRKAISLLHSCMPRREGLWDADVMEYVARRVVEMEEVGLEDFVASSANPALARETFMPPEKDRIVDVTIYHQHGSQDQDERMFSVTYMLKSVDGDAWLFRQEDVVLDSDSTYRRSRESTFTKSLETGIAWAATAFKLQ